VVFGIVYLFHQIQYVHQKLVNINLYFYNFLIYVILQDCSLHLDNVLTSLLTQQTAIGLMLAIGNEGTMKETHSDQLNLYLSRDAGFSWELVRSGPNEFTWGNYGGLFLSSSTSQSTNKVAFSWNQGLSWDACNFTASNLEVDDIIQIGGPETLKFLLFGTTYNGGSTKGSVTFLDFSTNLSTLCKFYLKYP